MKDSSEESDAAGDVDSRKTVDVLRNRKVIREMRNIADNEPNGGAAKVKLEPKVSLLITCHVRQFFIYFLEGKKALW